MRAAAVILLVALAAPAAADAPEDAPVPREGAAHAVPLYGDLLRPYDAPDNPYAPGHRGIKIGRPVGTAVRSSGDGVVSFAGSVAGNLTVSIDHGAGLMTTYTYLGSIAVTGGRAVARGDVVGLTGEGKPDEDLPPHVHLSARHDGVYFDPLALYAGRAIDDLLDLVA